MANALSWLSTVASSTAGGTALQLSMGRTSSVRSRNPYGVSAPAGSALHGPPMTSPIHVLAQEAIGETGGDGRSPMSPPGRGDGRDSGLGAEVARRATRAA